MTVYQMLDRECYVHITYHPTAKRYFATCFVKRAQGILYGTTSHVIQPPVGEIVDETVRLNCLSKRKYILGQRPDGSIIAPVFHLFDQYCKTQGLCSLSLYQRTYPHHLFTEEHHMQAIELAEWQGVEWIFYSWDTRLYKLLLEALSDAYLHPLRHVLEEKMYTMKTISPSC